MVPSITDIDDEERRPLLRRRSTDQPQPAKTFGYALAVLGIVGSIFTAGYNWRSVSIVEANQENFVRKDVQDQQLHNVNDRLSEISRQIEQLQVELRTQRRKE